MDLYTDTQKLVADSQIALSKISSDTELGERWLRKYLNNEFKDVGVRRLQRLRNYLLEQRSQVA